MAAKDKELDAKYPIDYACDYASNPPSACVERNRRNIRKQWVEKLAHLALFKDYLEDPVYNSYRGSWTPMQDDTGLCDLRNVVFENCDVFALSTGVPHGTGYLIGKGMNKKLKEVAERRLATGAVDGTLPPLATGGQTPPWKQQGNDARIIASDGKSAMDCVKLVEVSETDAKLSGLGGRVLVNNCSGPVEITWCYSPGDCDPGRIGASWTVQSGRSWPVSAEKNIRWAACHGANTAAFVKDSQGLSFYCSAPATK